jgi:hypothetical protein
MLSFEKSAITLFSVILLTSGFSAVVSAEEVSKSPKIQYTDIEINNILLDAGTPYEILNTMDSDYKREIVSTSGVDLVYQNTTTSEFSRDETTGSLEEKIPTPSGEFSPMSISPSDLKLSVQRYTTVSNGTTYHELYGYWEWLQGGSGPATGPGGIIKDSIGLAIPDGWEIQSTRYSAAWSYSWYFNGAWTGWSAAQTSGIGFNGQPDVINMYGASWEIQNQNYLGVQGYTYKGSVHLKMKNKGGTINRALLKYSEARTNVLGQFGVDVSWGPVSISYSPTSGSNEEASKDLSW